MFESAQSVKKFTFSTKNKKFRESYLDLRSLSDLTDALILARKNAQISQEDIAEKLHTKQPAIARLESGGFMKTSIEKLQDYAALLGYTLQISLVPTTPQAPP